MQRLMKTYLQSNSTYIYIPHHIFDSVIINWVWCWYN